MTEALATPTRFLLENGEWKLSPNIQNYDEGELNPFEFDFQERLLTSSAASNKYNTSKIWPLNSLQEAYLDTTDIPDLSPVSISPSTPSLSVSFSPTSSTGSSSPKNLSELNVQSPPSSDFVEEHQSSSYHNTRKQPRRHYFTDYTTEEEYKPKATHIQSGRKRRIVFEGDDAEERRKKFLERNRIAAYKCRQKKKNWVQELEQHADIADKQNEELRNVVAQLKEESIYLRDLLLTHSNCNCESVQTYLRKTSALLTANIEKSTYSPTVSDTPTSSFPTFQTSLDSAYDISTYPSFPEQSTGLTPFLNTSMEQSESTDYFS